jgi:cytochrome c biogenesis protein CcmG/thiol:disulfide interchange protein DsbE
MLDPMRTAVAPPALALLAAAALAAGDAPAAPGAVGAPMPKIDLPAVGGPPLPAGGLDGQVVLWEFWATWCTPCHVQVEILKALHPDARRAGVVFVGVATGEPRELVSEHLAKHPSPYPVLLDPDERLGLALEVVGLPTLVVVDRAGRIAWRTTGLTDRATLEAALAAAGAPLAPAAEP